MEIIRELLKQTEEREAGKMTKFHDPIVVHQIELMIDAGLVDGEAVFEKMAYIRRLTWAGHDFLDASKDDTIWNKAKEHIIKPSVSWTFSILLDYLKREAALKLGLPVP
jgi:hypothetical protein